MRINSLISVYSLAAAFILISSSVTLAASPASDPTDSIPHSLFTVGIGGGLIGGLYDGFYPYELLKKHGDFGLGAPDKLDGELLVFKGEIYKTQHTGKTSLVNEHELTSFAMVNFFRADRRLAPPKGLNKGALFHYLDSVLTNVNGMYAIHISGKFKTVKTRAFPPVKAHQHTPLAEMLNLQKFFEYKNCEGDLIGYRLPPFMDNTNISGYHFHYLSTQKDNGGHIIDLLTDDIVIEIDTLNSYTIQPPATKDFEHFDFKKNREEDIKSVERGGKN
ncbi:acetolactate decarboxylase [Pedobacter sp. PAMC26386]|nr:acetolactate decarboxylase [Pedobacter sp. PAMC26386]